MFNSSVPTKKYITQKKRKEMAGCEEHTQTCNKKKMMIVCYVFGLQKRPVRKREERGI
jgi:hypothetical protein